MTEAPMKPNRRERRIVCRKPSRSWNSAMEPMKPNGMMPAARAANTAICLGIESASASGMMPAEVAKSSAPRLRAHRRGWARAISAMRKNAAAVSTMAMRRVDRRLDVAHGEAQRPVDADHDVGAATRHDVGRFRDQGARSLLLRGGDAVLEVEDDRVGAAPCRPVDKA